MIEKVFNYYTGEEKKIEKIIMDENIHYIHMTFNKGEGLPEHFANSNVYMTVLRGKLSLGLNNEEIHKYKKGDILKIPFKTKMNVRNEDSETLELIVVKAPSPANI